MARVIVPKNCVRGYGHGIAVSGITASNIIGSTYTITIGLTSENINNDGKLGLNIDINYNLGSSTVNVPWTSSEFKNIKIENSVPSGCNFIILTVRNLPKIKNTGSTSGNFALILGLDNGIYFILFSPNTVAVGETITIPDQTYYIDLVNNVFTTDVNNIYNKAIIYNDSYWHAPKEIYTNNSNSTYYNIIPNNPFPYIFNDIEFRGPNYSTTNNVVSFDSATDVIINIDTRNNPSYVFLSFSGLPRFKNTSSNTLPLKLYINISGVKILIDSKNISSGFIIDLVTGSYSCMLIDVINKELIYRGSSFSDSDSNTILRKAITHL